MAMIKLDNEVHPIQVGEQTKYAPVYHIGGKHAFISHQGNIIYYDTKEEAEAHFEEE